IAIVGFFFLQARGVGQKDLQQVSSAARAKYRPAKTMADEARQIAGVVDVRVGNDHRVDSGCVERRLLPVAIAQIASTLKEPTIDQDARATGFDQIPRAGYRARRSPE